MKKYTTYFRSHWFLVFLTGIFLLSFILRFYHYSSRFGLAYDQAHDAVIARYALEHMKLPLLGPFSSAGPFQTGGEWYWIIMLGTAVFPFTLITPWIFLTLCYCFFVVGIALLGEKMGGKYLGVILGLLAATSPAQVIQGVNLTNQTPESVVSLLALFCSYLYLNKKQIHYLFLVAFCIGLGSTIHLQGVGLVPLLVMTFIMGRNYSVKAVGVCFLGVLIPWIPNLIVDSTHNFFNFRNMVQYYLHDQYQISLEVLGRRWKTYVGALWPTQWGLITGGHQIIGAVLFAGSFVSVGGAIYRQIILSKKSTQQLFILVIGISFLISFIVLRYTRTPLFDSYFVFLHPSVLLLTGYFLSLLFEKRIRVFGIILLTVVLFASLYRIVQHYHGASNYAAVEGDRRINLLQAKFPQTKFSVYSYHYTSSDKNSVLLLYLYKAGMVSNDGKKIGVVIATQSGQFTFPIIEGNKVGYQLLDLSSSSSAQLKKDSWVRMSPESFYEETQEWFLHHK